MASFESIAGEWEQQSHDQAALEVAAARNQVEQQANDFIGQLNSRLSHEASVTASLRGSLTQAQTEAQAEASKFRDSKQKTRKIESNWQQILN